MFAAGKTASGTVAATVDAQFNYVTMLLHGDGTNGAQNNTFLDSSTNNYTVTRTGNVTQGSFSPYGSNWSNVFTADSGSYLSVPYSSAFNLAGDFTVECWINPSKLPTANGTGAPLYPRIFSFGTYNAANSIGLELNSNDPGKVNAITVWYAGSQYYSANSLVAVGNWYHCAMVRSGTVITIYLNGTSVLTITGATAAVNTSQALYIASLQSYESNTDACFKGYISNLRVVKGTAVYTTTFTPPTTPLTAITNTTLLTCQSNRFVDNSTTAATISVFGTPSVQRFNPFGTATAYSTATIGGSGYFNGVTGNYLRTTGTVGIASSAFTICCWFYPLDSNVIGLFDSATVSVGTFRNYSANKIEDQTQAGSAVNFSGAYQVNAWNWMCITKSGYGFTVYINGSSVGTGGCYITLAESTFTVGGINNGGNGAYFGYISDFQVLNTATVVAVPTAPITNASGKTYLLNFQNGAIFDNAMMNDLETVGTAQISTSVYKYGTGSLYFSGSSGNYLKQSNSPQLQDYQLGSGDFTVEAWIYKTANNPNGYDNLVQLGTNGNATDGWFIEISSSRGYVFATNSTIITSYNVNPNTSAWQHFAVCRSGNNTRMFINGTQGGSTYTSAYTVPNTGTQAIIGGDGSTTLLFNGYVDDFRITKGYARYTANFTPPTAAFFNTGPY